MSEHTVPTTEIQHSLSGLRRDQLQHGLPEFGNETCVGLILPTVPTTSLMWGLLIADQVDPCLDFEVGSSPDQIQAASVQAQRLQRLIPTLRVFHHSSSRLRYRIAMGLHAGRKALTLYTVPPLDAELNNPLLARLAGFSRHAATVCEAYHRSRLERLCRYITRPPIATKQLSVDAQGRVG